MKVAIYTRVSSERQVQEGFSLEAQYDRLLEYIKMNGWDLVRVYTDPGISGKNLKDRPGVQEMLDDAKQDKFDAILIHKLDRLTRNIGDLHDLIELFNKKSIKLISFSENIDTSTPSGRMFVYFLGVFAQMYRENLAEEVTKGLTKRAEKGLRVNFKPVYGYDIVDHVLYVNDEEAAVVRKIFELFRKGWGKQRIANYLNDSNLTSKYGIWYDRTVGYILANPTYIGKHHYTPKGDKSKRIVKDGAHKPIISEEMFIQVQKLMERKSDREISQSSKEYPFSTITKCGQCGQPYHGKFTRNENNKMYRFYACYGRLRKNNGCTASDISELKLEKLLFGTVLPKMKLLAAEEQYAAAKEPNSVAADTEKLRKQLERELSKSETRKANWAYAFGDGKMPYDDYVKLMDSEMNRVAEIKKQLDELNDEPPEAEMSYEEFVSFISQLQTFWKDMDASERKRALQSLFKSITINKEPTGWVMIVE